ncbi:MAG: S-layer homology domain-containing protein [Clostridia bacterium]|nr:S-layer homology domain-containing protein [Clostridia bacterium]
MKKYISILIIVLVLSFTASVYAAEFKDVPRDAIYKDALNRVTALNIMGGVGNGLYKPNSLITREQFAKVIVVAAGLQDTALSLKGASIFPDVNPKNWSNGYIQAALNNGFIIGMPDGKFKPAGQITFAQACTVMVRALGYTDQDVPGIWPGNYTGKAQILGLTQGISLRNNEGLPRWALTLMVDRLLNTYVKSTGDKPDKTYAENVKLYTEFILLANPLTNSKLADNQVLTDKGIFYVKEKNANLSIGNKYRVKIKEDAIEKVYDSLKTTYEITVSKIDGTKVSYFRDGKQIDLTLPEKTVYYYNGAKQNYEQLKNFIQKNSSIVFAYNDGKTGYEYAVVKDSSDKEEGQYMECVILGNSKTLSTLTERQVMTDKGIYNLPSAGINLELGNQYGLLIKEDDIVKTYEKLKETLNITVDSVLDMNIRYRADNKVNTLNLPQKTVYYYHGVKQNYDSLKGILQKNTAIIFAYSDDRKGYEYGLILDPQYSKPETAISFNPLSKKLGAIDFSEDISIVKNGETIHVQGIEERDIVYSVTDLWGANRYILVLNDKIEGKITGILPNKLSPKTVQIDNKNYDLSKDLNLGKINNTPGSFKVDDNVSALIGYDGKIVDILKLEKRSGPFTECIILGDSRTMSNLSENQVFTDQGIFYMEGTGIRLDLGNKYKLVLDGDTIVRIGDKQKVLFNITVDNTVGTKVIYEENGMMKSMVLPDRTIYYYKGAKQNYDSVKNLLKLNTSLIFANNNSQTGYEYALIIDPVYSKPEIAKSFEPLTKKLGNITFKEDVTVLRNGSVSSIYNIEENDVVYVVSDIWGKNSFINVVNNKITGTISAVSPNKLAPKTLLFSNGTSCELSEYMDFSKVNNPYWFVNVGIQVTAILGHDAKVVDVILAQ